MSCPTRHNGDNTKDTGALGALEDAGDSIRLDSTRQDQTSLVLSSNWLFQAGGYKLVGACQLRPLTPKLAEWHLSHQRPSASAADDVPVGPCTLLGTSAL